MVEGAAPPEAWQSPSFPSALESAGRSSDFFFCGKRRSTRSLTARLARRQPVGCLQGSLPMPISAAINDLVPEVRTWRREIHQHPGVMYDVEETAKFVADRLRAFGCDEVKTEIGRTGVVGVIRGAKGASPRSIGLRADMDALPIEEQTNLPYRSKTPGKMHACGHDGHTAMLLGAARRLARDTRLRRQRHCHLPTRRGRRRGRDGDDR